MAKTEKLYDQYRTPAFYTIPVVKRGEFLRRTKMTEEELNQTIHKFETEFPESIWQEDFNGVQVHHISTFGFTAVTKIIGYIRQ